jgi:hypothetical protein
MVNAWTNLLGSPLLLSDSFHYEGHTTFRGVESCSLIDRDVSARLHGVKSKNSLIFIFTAIHTMFQSTSGYSEWSLPFCSWQDSVCLPLLPVRATCVLPNLVTLSVFGEAVMKFLGVLVSLWSDDWNRSDCPCVCGHETRSEPTNDLHQIWYCNPSESNGHPDGEGTRRLIATCTRARHWSLFSGRAVSASHPYSVSAVMVSPSVKSSLPFGFLDYDFTRLVRAICLAHLSNA